MEMFEAVRAEGTLVAYQERDSGCPGSLVEPLGSRAFTR